MTQSNPDVLRRLRVPAYLVLWTALVFALVDFVMAIAPLQGGNVMWRFGALGLSANAVVTPLVLCVLVYAIALYSGDRGMVMMVGVFAALLSLFLLVAVGAFSLDALQMRSRVQPAAHSKFIAASAVAVVKLILECIIAAVLALSAFRANRATRRVTGRGARAAAPIVGARGATVAPATSATIDREGGIAP